MGGYFFPFLVLLTASNVPIRQGAKILGFPASVFRTSHLKNDEKILTILANSGHEVFLLANDAYRPSEFVVKAGVKLITFPRPPGLPPIETKYSLQNLSEHFMQLMMESTKVPPLLCESLLKSPDILERIRQERFDLVYYNFASFCKGVVQAVLKGTPSVEFFSSDGFLRSQFKELPLAISYLPGPVHYAGQNMSFNERIMNFFFQFAIVHYTSNLRTEFEQIARKYGIELVQPESLALIFGGFPMEYPAPILPDMVYLNGLLVPKAEPLQTQLEAFVQSSGEHGVIMMSFGSLVNEYDEYHGNLFAEAFARMPQKVLWKYDGPTPKTLGENTKLVKWLPQTSLLAHPKTRVFITHCGMNSAYETIMYGVPVVAIPIFSDQPQIASKLTLTHKVGVMVNFKTLTVDNLVEALNEVINTPVYKGNAIHLASYLKDQPISGKDLLLYWVDYVIRHKGVSHLKPYGRFLPWYQFYSLDVAAFLSTVIAAIFVLLYCCFVHTCRRCCKRTSKSKTK